MPYKNHETHLRKCRERYLKTRVLKTVPRNDPSLKSVQARAGSEVECRVCHNLFKPTKHKVDRQNWICVPCERPYLVARRKKARFNCIACGVEFFSLIQGREFERKRMGYCNSCGRRSAKNYNSAKKTCIRGHLFSVEGARRRCKTCQRETVRISSGKRRAEKRTGISTFTPSQWELLLKVFNQRCAYCLIPSLRLEQDHVIPLSRGGSHTLQNIVPACVHCNRSKHDRIWKPLLKFGTAA
jgi:5-methylcytosine-specific restriction endonuclease McrA